MMQRVFLPAWLLLSLLFSAGAFAQAPVVTVAPATLPDGAVGTAYGEVITASGTTGPYTFFVGAGALPPGLTLTTGGMLSGAPTTIGTYNFTIVAEDGASSGSRAYTVEIFPAASIEPPTLPDAEVGEPYEQALSVANGGAIGYTFAVAAGELPAGLTLAANGVLAGTPTAAGAAGFTVTAVPLLLIDGGSFAPTAAPIASVSRTYTLAVAAAPIVLAPTALPDGIVGTAYDQAITAGGGTPPYLFSVDGSLPPGLALASDGRLAGTPTTAGSYAFVVHATDAFAQVGGLAYDIDIAEAPPVAVDDEATTPSQQAVSIAVVANDNGAIDTIAIVSAPEHGSATVDGMSVEYQPTGTFFGDDSFTYTVSGPGGTSAPATVAVHVTALPVPVGVPQAVTTLAGVAVTIHAAEGASGAPITEVAIVEAPATGTLVISGTDLVYTPAIDASGTVGVVYTLSNDYGVSAPVASTVTVEPVPIVASLHATTPMGIAVGVGLTDGASGGPFTGAEVLSLSPADAGTAAIAPAGDGFRLDFAPAAGFLGVASVAFTVSNAHATSAPGTVEITVTARPDPTLDPEVGGLVAAQVAIVRNFADAQILNVQDRLETLHEPGPRPWGFWIGGSVRHGDRDADAGSASLDFETSGISAGADYRFGDRFAIGGGVGYGRDRTLVGGNGGRADARARSGMGYASFRPSLPWFLDMVGGYQRITFRLRRFVSDTGAVLEAPRDGTQAFSSWSSGYEHKGDAWTFSSYARMDLAQARLDAYSEAGDPLHALSFGEQAIQTRTSTVGVRARFKRAIRWGTLEPRVRIEFQRDFHDASGAAIAYSDLQSGPVYVLPGDALDRNRMTIEVGTVFKSSRGYVMRLEYRGVRGGAFDNDNALVFSFQDDH